jgi:transcriptional regulator with XRE-family HTH domain
MANEIIKPLIQQLVKARKRKGWSQDDVANRLGFRQSYLSAIESGKHDVRLGTFVDIARLLDLELVVIPKQISTSVEQMAREFTGDTYQTEEERAFIPVGDDD